MKISNEHHHFLPNQTKLNGIRINFKQISMEPPNFLNQPLLQEETKPIYPNSNENFKQNERKTRKINLRPLDFPPPPKASRRRQITSNVIHIREQYRSTDYFKQNSSVSVSTRLETGQMDSLARAGVHVCVRARFTVQWNADLLRWQCNGQFSYDTCYYGKWLENVDETSGNNTRENLIPLNELVPRIEFAENPSSLDLYH